MKYPLRLLGLAAVTVSALAQAPDSLTNTVLHELISSPDVHAASERYVWIDGSNTVRELWHSGNIITSPYTVITPTIRPYDYRKLTDTTAQFQGNLVYTFETPTGGTARQYFLDTTIVLTFVRFTVRPAQANLGAANVSSRATLGANGTAIVGIVLPPGGARLVLVRAIGTTLADLGVSNPASGMHVSVYSGNQVVAPVNRIAWNSTTSSTAAFANLFTLVGAFPLSSTRGESCLLLDLSAGPYTAVMSADTPGDALLEAYFLP